ncbi:uncharacterized protein [Ptychodera flava]|uniref:uncharacterized protein n=1 Tax=Ptychodera flava TaxID=63121 RepID=UPI00396A9EC1
MASPTKEDSPDTNNHFAVDNDTSEQESQSDAASSSDDAGNQEKHKPAEFDGDPDELCSQLENMELTEEETEELLKEAMEINKKLKAELKRQEREMSAKSAKRHSRGTPTGERPGSGRYGVLPPIQSKGSAQRHAEKDKIYGVKLSHAKTGHTSQSSSSSTKSRDRTTISSGHGSKRQSPVKSGRVTQSADPKLTRSKGRPEWNDRFSFS